ncbi:MAG: O-antigen ligase family protein [Dehalococcoidia bacterium]
MSDVALPLGVAAALVALGLAIRAPKLLIPAVVLLLPIEYFSTILEDDLGASGAGGAVRAMLNPGKAAMAVTVVFAIVRARHDIRSLLPQSQLVIPLAALVAILWIGLLWADSISPPNLVLVVVLYFAFLMVAPSFIEDRKDIDRIVAAVLIAAIWLGALAVAQRLGGVFQWRGVLIQSDEASYRSNATFSDPNILARHLSLAMALAAGLILTYGPRRLTVYLALPALLIGGMGILMTASRSGWLLMVLATALMIFLAPIARYTKLRILGGGGAAVVAMLALVLAQGGSQADRIRSLTDRESVLGLREFLIKAGWEMFKDNPIHGVGTGGFEHALVTSYIDILPDWARTTLSHTSLVSILAELGLIGVVAFGFVGVKLAIVAAKTYAEAREPGERLITGWAIVAVFGVILQSQSEGRLLDDPYLWFYAAILVAMEIRHVTARSSARWNAGRLGSSSTTPSAETGWGGGAEATGLGPSPPAPRPQLGGEGRAS